MADANALIEDVVRRARGRFSLMPLLAERSLVMLLSAQHIDEKVMVRLPRACRKTGADLSVAMDIYNKLYRPRLRLVDVGDLMADDERVSAVALVDEEDVPVAQLGVLLAPCLVLTRDGHLLDAGLGVSEWADALVLTKELVELDQMMESAATGVLITGALAYGLTAAFVRLLQRSEMALGLSIGASAALLFHFWGHWREVPGRIKERSGPVIDKALTWTADLSERREATNSQLRTTLVHPHEADSLEVAVARVLLQCTEPLGGATIHSRLSYEWRGAGAPRVMDVLRREPAFELVRGRGWMLGHHCQAVQDQGLNSYERPEL